MQLAGERQLAVGRKKGEERETPGAKGDARTGRENCKMQIEKCKMKKGN